MPVPVSILRLYFDCVECKKRFDTIDDCYAHEKTHSTTRSVETMTEEASVQSQPSGFIPVGASYASPKRSISPVDKEEEKKTNRRKPEIPQNSTNYDTEEDIQKIEELRCTTAMEPDLNATAPTIAQPSNLIAVARGLSAAVNTVAVDEVEENSSPQYKVINGRVMKPRAPRKQIYAARQGVFDPSRPFACRICHLRFNTRNDAAALFVL